MEISAFAKLLFGDCLSRKQEVLFFCVREEPVLFLHKDADYVPYTPRRKENLHENLHGLQKEELSEGLELTIRKEVKLWTLCPGLIWFPTVRHKPPPLPLFSAAP